MAEGSPKTIRELLVKLGIVQKDPKGLDRFNAGVDRAKAGLATLGRFALGATAAATTVVGALVKVTLDAAAMGDSLDEAAQRIGIGVEALQELQFAASLGGVSSEDLAQSLKFVARNADAAARGSSEAGAMFRRLGVQIRDPQGRLRSVDDLLSQVAAGLPKLATNTERVAAVTAIFGRSGERLIPLLSEGADGIAKLRLRARELGIVMRESDVKAAAGFSDRLDELKASAIGLRNQLGIALLPALDKVVSGAQKWLQGNRELIRQRIDAFAANVTRWVERAGHMFQRIDLVVRTRLGGWSTVFVAVAGGLALLIGAKGFAGLTQVVLGTGQAVWGLWSAFLAFDAVVGIGLLPLLLVVVGVLSAVAGSLATMLAWAIPVGLAVEDLWTFFQGGKSVTGELIGLFVDADAVSASLRRTWASLTRFGDALWGALKRIGMEIAIVLAPAFDAVYEAMVPVFQLIRLFVTDDLVRMIEGLNQWANLLDRISLGLEAFGRGANVSTSLGIAGVPGFGNNQAILSKSFPGGKPAAARGAVTNAPTVQISGIGISPTEAKALIELALQTSWRQAHQALAAGER